MQEKLSAHANADGSAIDLAITQADGKTATLAIPVEEIGYLVTGLLSAAIDSAEKSGKPSHLSEEPGSGKYVRFAHEADLTPADDGSEQAILVFAIGGTDLAIAVPREIAAPLGAALQEVGSSRRM